MDYNSMLDTQNHINKIQFKKKKKKKEWVQIWKVKQISEYENYKN